MGIAGAGVRSGNAYVADARNTRPAPLDDRTSSRSVTLPLILPGYFAGAIIVFIWAFTDLGTPLIFGFSRVVPVQIFDAVN